MDENMINTKPGRNERTASGKHCTLSPKPCFNSAANRIVCSINARPIPLRPYFEWVLKKVVSTEQLLLCNLYRSTCVSSATTYFMSSRTPSVRHFSLTHFSNCISSSAPPQTYVCCKLTERLHRKENTHVDFIGSKSNHFVGGHVDGQKWKSVGNVDEHAFAQL